jgi:hypothetical protein
MIVYVLEALAALAALAVWCVIAAVGGLVVGKLIQVGRRDW